MAFDIEGRLIVCEHVTSSVTRFHADGYHETVCFHHKGVYLNSPNDLVASSRDGSIYFTIPTTAGGTIGSAASASHCLDSRPCSGCRTREAKPNSSSIPASSSSPTGCAFRPTSH